MKKDKKNMVMVIVIGVALCLFLCFNTTVFATTGTVTTSDLRLRKENSTSSQILDLLDENQEVEIISEDGDWYKIKVGNKVGYVSKEFVKVKENANIIENITNSNNTENKPAEEQKTEENTENSEKTEEPAKETIVAEESSLRIMPAINGDVINTVKSNQKVTVISNVGVWSYVTIDSTTGWILTNNLKTEEVKTSSENENNQNKEEQQNNNEENTENKTEETVVEEKTETMYSSSKTYYIAANSVNVRSQATKSSNVVKVLSLNNEVTVTGECGEWYIVSVNGTKAYIAKTLLSTTKKEVTSRSTTTVSTPKPVAENNESNEETAQESYEEPSAPAASSTGAAVASYAQRFVGYPYVYGASGPNSFDCSGFAQYVYRQYGYSLNRTAAAQASNGYAVSRSNLQPGDLVFFNTSGGISHVGIYIGGDQFVHASSSRTGVIISSLSQSYYASRYVTARRIA